MDVSDVSAQWLRSFHGAKPLGEAAAQLARLKAQEKRLLEAGAHRG